MSGSILPANATKREDEMTLKQFLQRSYTAYHAVENAGKMLEEAGFRKVTAEELPALHAGDKGYAVWGGTTLVAFKVGEDAQVTLAESHTDSPALKVKTAATVPSKEGYRINVEKYGGGLLYSMLDVPLRVAGRVVVETATGVEAKLVVSKQTVVIPSLCIHHNPDHNDLSLNVQTDMLPLVGDVENVYDWVAEGEKVLDADLYVVADVEPFASGAKGEYLSSPRLDNLTSVYASVRALIEAEPKGISVAAAFDNEEIGSGTKRGAASAYLKAFVEKIVEAAGHKNAQKAMTDGLALSIDNGHAVHPAHPEKSDVVDGPVLGGGVVVKHHVNYATEGLSAGMFKRIMDMSGIPYQDYYNRSDIPCGSTLGNISARNLLMDTVDVGIAQLAMHSAVETACEKDVDTMEKAVKAVFNARLRREGNEVKIEL